MKMVRTSTELLYCNDRFNCAYACLKLYKNVQVICSSHLRMDQSVIGL